MMAYSFFEFFFSDLYFRRFFLSFPLLVHLQVEQFSAMHSISGDLMLTVQNV